jgi:competence protein ComEC
MKLYSISEVALKHANRFLLLMVAVSITSVAAVFSLAYAAEAAAGAAGTLRIYFIDVEGGQATLLVTPRGGSLLVDTGWPDANGRDARRIVRAAREAGLKRIDFVLITHFHTDHVGGAPALAARIPVGTFVDHGKDVETGKEAGALDAGYQRALERSKRMIAKPGDSIPLEGAEVTVVTADGARISSPLPDAGQPNPFCAESKPQETDTGENARSVGILVTFGKFRFLDLGDLTWNKELDLMCPANSIGTVDVFMVSHHGMNISNSPALVWALHPRVAVMNNGETKGGTPEAWQIVEKSPGLLDLWQLHFSRAGGREHNVAERMIANLQGRDGSHELRLAARPDGSFTIENSRNAFVKTYSKD